MKRENYELYKWYPLTDDEYWVDLDYQDEFSNCQTLVYDTTEQMTYNTIMRMQDCQLGWSTMAKTGTYMFMIVEKPKN